MTIWWCRTCGMEDTRAHDACPSCGAALETSEVAWLNEGDGGEELIYELETEPSERAAIVAALHEGGIRHRWDNIDDLVVPETDEVAADKIVDDVLGAELEEVDAEGNVIAPGVAEDAPDDEEAEEDDEWDESNEDDYEVISQFYFTTDRLLKRWEDEDVDKFLGESGELLVQNVPFGVDEEEWAETLSLARNCAASLNDDREADIEEQLTELRNRLQSLV